MQFGTSPFSAFSFSSEVSGSSLNMKERRGRYLVQSPVNTGTNHLFYPTLADFSQLQLSSQQDSFP